MIPDYVTQCFPERKKESHKGTYGRVMVVAGSYGMMGAALMSSRGALRTGAGLVYIASPYSLVPFYNIAFAEAVIKPYAEKNGSIAPEVFERLIEDSSKMSALVVGPGLGQTEETHSIVMNLIRSISVPVVLDADGINVLNKAELKSSTAPLIITPHPGEFAKLTGNDIATVINDGPDLAVSLAGETNCIVVLKGHRTVITDGRSVTISDLGNPGMATAGAGDVLSGIIGAIAGMGNPLLSAALAGVYVHSMAGDLAAKNKGQYGMISSDIIESVPEVLKKV